MQLDSTESRGIDRDARQCDRFGALCIDHETVRLGRDGNVGEMFVVQVLRAQHDAARVAVELDEGHRGRR